MSRDLNLTLEQRRNIELCDNERDFILVVDIGVIQESDSLFGFDIGINYNPDLIDMKSALTTNTVAQFFDLKDAKFNSEFKLISFTGGVINNLNNPISTDRPLIAFFGEFIGSCTDTAEFTLRYFEATSEFKGVIAETTEVSITGNINEENLEKIDLLVSDEELNVKKDSSITIPVDINYEQTLGLNDLMFKVTTNSDSLTLDDIEFNENINLVSADNGEYVFSDVSEGIGTINCLFTSSKVEAGSFDVTFEAIPLTECSCVGLPGSTDKKIINLETKLSTNVLYEKKEYYTFNQNVLSIESSEVKQIIVCDINGRTLTSINYFDNITDLSQFGAGMYILKIIYQNDKIELEKIIKY